MGLTSRRLLYLPLYLLVVLLAACSSGGSENGPAAAIESYNRALVAKDENGMINLSCADWEESARNELNSFGAVTPTIRDLSCTEQGEENGYTLVTCEGVIDADYGNEVLSIQLSDRTYRTVEEGGEWRMCGYQ
jgi:hypothetical protein